MHVDRINPRSASAYFYLAKIQEYVPQDFIGEDLHTPETYYQKALALDPLHIGSRMELIDRYEKAGELEKAAAALEQGASYRYNSTKAMDFFGYRMKFYVRHGNKEMAQKSLEKWQSYEVFLQRNISRQQKTIWQLFTEK